MSNRLVAVLDIGSSFVKGGVIELETLQLLDCQRVPFPDPIPGLPAGYFEVDVESVLKSVESVLDRLFNSYRDCESLHTCTQMGGVVLTDRFGVRLSNYLSWRDQRTTSESVSSRLSVEERCQLGNEIRPGTALTLLNWLSGKKELPADCVPQSLGDYVLSRLTCSGVVSEPTSAMGLIKLGTNRWHLEVFEKLGLPTLAWPPLAKVEQPVGVLNRFAGVPCYPAVGDHQAALLGTLLGQLELSINISTGSQVSLLTDEPRVGRYQTRPFFGGQFLNTITHIPAGRSLTALVGLLTELSGSQGVETSDPWSYIDRQASQSPDLELDVEPTFFDGTFGNRGRIENISLDNLNVGALFRACFRKMSQYYATCAAQLAAGSDGRSRAWNRIVLSGGLAKLDTIRQFIYAKFPEMPVRTCDVPDETLAGLAILALFTSRTCRSVGDAVERARSIACSSQTL